ncbi:YaaC family protein [Amycolatopsis sp. NPDC051758]|uniref:YaaC family protein n=1 Tax=Amycolatopsis sp. NPDC051758 TaxID=3363935 RepID=UPI0037BD9509
MTRLTSWQDIRALRATPPGLATADVDRRRAFVAALRQAEELAEAAASASYATKALPLFYALSQAGRAIAAAHLPDPWQLHGHGLSVRSEADRILDSVVRPASGAQNSFQGTAAATGSPALSSSVPLGALWAANPDLREVHFPAATGAWPRPITIPLGTMQGPLGSDPGYAQRELQTHGMVETAVDVPGKTAAEVTTALNNYPSLRPAFGVKQGVIGPEKASGTDIVVRTTAFDGMSLAAIGLSCPRVTTPSVLWGRMREFVSIVEVDPEHRHDVPRQFLGFALPEVAGGPSPHPLMLWWALLLGLSSLTRYEPAAWSEAVDLDRSEMAVPLEQVLDIAEERLPARILTSLRP